MPHQLIDELFNVWGVLKRNALSILRYSVLAAGILAMIAMTVPELRGESGSWLKIVLWGCLGFFALELVVKTWLTWSDPDAGRYPLTLSGIIDLLSVLPVPIALLSGMAPPSAWLLASLWLLKLTPVGAGLSLLGRVIQQEARPLTSVGVLFLIVLLLAAVALYVLEGSTQPERFGSVPRALWWAVTTLTTTGYGDAVPETAAGRMIAALVMVCGLGLFGLWAGILATGFAAEHRRRDFIRNWDLVTSVPFLRNLNAPAIIELTRMLRRIDLPERSVVVRRGRPGDCMYFIASGEVEVRLEPNPIRLSTGAFFGEIALLDGGPRTATVTTTMPSTLLVLEVSDFRAFTAHHPELAQSVEIEAARRRDVKEEIAGKAARLSPEPVEDSGSE